MVRWCALRDSIPFPWLLEFCARDAGELELENVDGVALLTARRACSATAGGFDGLDFGAGRGACGSRTHLWTGASSCLLARALVTSS